MRKTVGVLGTFDTKSEELFYLAEQIRLLDVDVLTIDVSAAGSFNGGVDVTGEEVARLAGRTLAEIADVSRKDALDIMSCGAQKMTKKLYEEGRIHGLVSMGGSGGTV